MKIEEIENPQFLKTQDIRQLEILAHDIRKFLIDSVSKTGGHLSSNLGVVELTIALHSVFNTPTDKILFDVGHQSYVHKILTGRANAMHTLRQFNGISGFQNRNESEYDSFDTGHSGTALSTALGMAVARDLNKEKYEIIPVVGDGALMSGLSLEALNQIGFEKKKLIIVFNDNNMSISKNVGALNKSFSKMRSSVAYNQLKSNVKEYLKDNKHEKVISTIHNAKETIKKSVIDSGIFKEFGINYLGPIDGHNINSLIKAFRSAQSSTGPIVVHVITKKGKGYKYTEEDRVGLWHGVGKFDKETGKFLNDVPPGYLTYSKFVSNCISQQMSSDRNVVAITPAMKTGSCMNELFAKYPERCFDCGIAEDHALQFAAGLALNNKHPFVSVYSSFLQRAYDQLNHDICRMNLPVVIGIDRAGLVGNDGSSHHGVFDISFLRSLPNMIIAQGKDATEISNLIRLAFELECPFALRYPRGYLKNEIENDAEKIVLGKWEYLNNNDNRKAIIITYGEDVNNIENQINENGLEYDVINARFIKPLDYELLDKISKFNVPIYIYTTDILAGGLGEAISSYYSNKHIIVKIHSFGIDDKYVSHGSNCQLKESLNIDIMNLFETIKKDLNA